MDKVELKRIRKFHNVDPDELGTLEEWAEYLDAILHENCAIFDYGLDDPVLIDIKARVDTIDGLKLEVHPDEHPPPHFHVRSSSGDVDAAFRIDNCERMYGDISGPDHKKVRYWHKRSKEKLIDAWNSFRPTDCQVGGYREPQ